MANAKITIDATDLEEVEDLLGEAGILYTTEADS
jgi:hypothetical protein